MKTTRYFTFTLLSFVMLTLVSSSFAQDVLSEPGVRLVYFLPNDRPARPEKIEALRQLIKDVQAFYADEMERHGYGRKTFTIETDKDGEPVVHRVDGRFNDAHYHQETINKVWKQLRNTFDTPQYIYFVVINISNETLDGRCGGAKGYSEQRVKGFLIPASGHCFNFHTAAHELGHAFALEHDFRDNAYIMSYGSNRNSLSKCAAEWLDAHGHFNNASAQVNRDAKIQMLAPTAAPPNGIRLRFEINGVDLLHQAMLYLKPTLTDPARDFKLDGCHLFETKNNTIEFVTSKLVDPYQDEVTLQVIDKQGRMKRQKFPIEFAHLLPPPIYVSIPDPNLASAVRKALELGSDAPISQRALQRLTKLDARKSEIKNLTGLEHAVRLRLLELRENQISDIHPLMALKHLEKLILDRNKVRDITPLTNITQLRRLLIGDNLISDFAPLSNLRQLEGLSLWANNIKEITFLTNLTNLTHLGLSDNTIDDIRSLTNLTKLESLNLSHNQISDVSPLIGLTKIETLHLQGNPIKNRKPLLAMLRRNPEMKIYLKGGEPLPVTLSHFRAEFTAAGVILKWITESELDNAGFYIYRSETRDGTFKVVNPTLIQGAGTTSERNTYTWTDTTATPNTVYYYRIEDISYAGARKQLATVRLKGLMSATGKMSTRWADLKGKLHP